MLNQIEVELIAWNWHEYELKYIDTDEIKENGRKRDKTATI